MRQVNASNPCTGFINFILNIFNISGYGENHTTTDNTQQQLTQALYEFTPLPICLLNIINDYAQTIEPDRVMQIEIDYYTPIFYSGYREKSMLHRAHRDPLLLEYYDKPYRLQRW